MKYKILWITLCFNELDILPFVEQYWKRIATKVVVFDNGSSDGSIEYLSQQPYVEIRHFESQGQNDVIQKTVKEQAYQEFKDQYDIIIISDMDELFYFEDFDKEADRMIKGNFNTMLLPLYSLCEDEKPRFQQDKLLHQLCHKFYKQRMNHMKGLEAYSKISIFNTKTTEQVRMSVGQHYVQTTPTMRIMLANASFGLHIDKGFGLKYKWEIRQKMFKNLSETNKRGGMAIEYGMSYDQLKEEYERNQSNSFDINKKSLA